MLHESWLDELVAGSDCARKLKAFEVILFAWILLLSDEILVQVTKHLASHFCFFSGIMLCRNFCEVQTATSYFGTIYDNHDVWGTATGLKPRTT